MTSGPKPGAETDRLHLTYDAWNRLVAAYADDEGEAGNLIAEYQYDGQGRRIAKIVREVDGETVTYQRTDYQYDEAWQAIEERTDSFEDLEVEGGALETPAETPAVQWLWDVRYVDAPVLRWRSVSGTLDEVLYFCNDANMNVTALVNTSGTVVERYVYDPYGKAMCLDLNWANGQATSRVGNEILYCGYRFDPETGLDHVRYRYYHPTLGRWTQRDPLRYAAGMDLQEYGVGSPVNYTDWAGLAPAQPKVVTHRNLDWSDFRGTVPANAIRDASVWAHVDFFAWEPGYEVKKTAQSNCAGLTWEVEIGGRKIKGKFKADYHQCYEFKAWIKPETSLVMNFKPERSWAKPDVLAHPENHTSLLRHEQGHMRIVEALMAFYNAELAAKKPGTILVYHCVTEIGEEKTKGVIQAYLDELYGRAKRFEGSLQAQYEDETGHGRNADAQKRWDALLGNPALPLTPPEPPE